MGAVSAEVLGERAEALRAAYGGYHGIELLRAMVEDVFPDRIAVTSSFGAEAAVLLDLVSQVDRTLPVVFLETGKLFRETLDYAEDIVAHLGLTDVRVVHPVNGDIEILDADSTLWRRNPDMCCFIRKVAPLQVALEGFDACVTGRKRFHNGARGATEVIAALNGRIAINLLANWTHDAVRAAFAERGLPEHPMRAAGYVSIGCTTCTRRIADDEGIRDGRWPGTAKTECGIHLPQPVYDPA
jgi:phosphoadenosine phosphosulfate reductase